MYLEGEVIAGKYRVEKLLGQGGMGVVVAARHLQLQERVAVKLMLTDDSNEEAAERFVREARAAARIESDHVAHVSDVGVTPDGRAYLVMEYLDGQDLSQLLTSRGRLPAAEAVDYLLQACEAIAEAHSLGIVHRDLKPSNLFLTRRRDRTPHVKVLDFGISKMGTPSMAQISITNTAALMGSPLYMSPEQMTSTKDVDARSDVWALGVVLYELLSGRAPFDGETLPQVCSRVMQEQPPPLLELVPDLPVGLPKVATKCLEKRPEARYQSLAELALALAPFGTLDSFQSVERIQRLLGAPDFLLLAPNQTSPTPRMERTVAGTLPALQTQTSWAEPQIPMRNPSRLPWMLGAFAGVLLLGAAGAWVKGARDPITPASGPAPHRAAQATGVAPPLPSALPSAEPSPNAAPRVLPSAAASAAKAPLRSISPAKVAPAVVAPQPKELPLPAADAAPSPAVVVPPAPADPEPTPSTAKPRSRF